MPECLSLCPMLVCPCPLLRSRFCIVRCELIKCAESCMNPKTHDRYRQMPCQGKFTRFEQRCYTLLLKLVNALLMLCRIATMTSQGLPTLGFKLDIPTKMGERTTTFCSVLHAESSSVLHSRMYLRTSEDDVAEVTHPWCDASLCFECATTFRSCRWWQFWRFAFVVHLRNRRHRQ